MSPWNNRDPIRAELFSAERLEEHARSLAAAQPVTPKAAKGKLLKLTLTTTSGGKTVTKSYSTKVRA